MRRLITYLRNYKKECVLAPLFKMLEAVFELTVPIVIARLIDKGIGEGASPVIAGSFALLIVLAAVGLTVSAIAQYFAAKAATGFARELRHDLFEHILSFGFPEIDDIGTSTMITRMTVDANTLQNGVNMFLRLFLRSPFIVAGAMIMAFTIDPVSALVFVAVIFVLSIIVACIMKTNIPLLKNAQRKLDDVLYLVRENLSGARVIRAFTLEDGQIQNFEDNNASLTTTMLCAGRVSALLNPLTYVCVNTAIAALIIVGGWRIDAGVLTTGLVVALYNYMSQILIELIKFANLIVIMNRSLASAARVNEIFERTSSMKEPEKSVTTSSDNSTPVIEFRDVSLRYNEGADEAISNVSFKIMKGETFGIIGGTGAGKTSIASLIPRFYDATCGHVLINGVDVRDIATDELRRRTGIVMQSAVMFEGSIRDNLKWGNDNASDEEIMAAVEAAVCKDVIDAKGGLDAQIEANGRNLSGGQRQRLSIARVLLSRPDILILDDSSSALDHITDQKLRSNIAALDYDPTVIIIAQRAISVMDCDNILVLDDGRIKGYGAHEQLLKECDIYKEIYDSQDYGDDAEDD